MCTTCTSCEQLSYVILTAVHLTYIVMCDLLYVLRMCRTVKVRGEEIQTPNKPDTAAGTRDAMAKVCMYVCMCVLLKHIVCSAIA
jgi:hypothetical protein